MDAHRNPGLRVRPVAWMPALNEMGYHVQVIMGTVQVFVGNGPKPTRCGAWSWTVDDIKGDWEVCHVQG